MVTEAIKNKDTPPPSGRTAWVIPCWLCGEPVPIKFTKKNKPFLICNNCGVQTFIRYGKAEELLMDKVEEYRNQQTGGK